MTPELKVGMNLNYLEDLSVEQHFMGDSSYRTFEIRSGRELVCQLHEDFVEPEMVPKLKGTAHLFRSAPEMHEILSRLMLAQDLWCFADPKTECEEGQARVLFQIKGDIENILNKARGE